MLYKKLKNQKGFTLVELLIGVSVFTIICVSVYGAYVSIFETVSLSRSKLEAVDLANEQLEIVRNLPYADVGILGGIPNGKLTREQTLLRGQSSFFVTTTVRNVDDPFDGTLGGAPNDLSPADFKLVEVQIDCFLCKNFKPVTVTTRVAAKNLETASTNGALFVRVFDGNGNPISLANVHMVNNQTNPPIVIDDLTNVDGMLQIVDAPPGINAYDITVTKSGYSTDRTYSASINNPNPSKPHATVVLQQVTQLSFVIDKLSTLNLSSVTQTCSPVPSIDFNIKGAKLIGTNPDVLKYNSDKLTNGSGLLPLNNLEWDSYVVTLTDAGYDLVGVSPISPINLMPDSIQDMQLVVAPQSPRTLLVSAKDSATNLPLSGVNVTISKTGFISQQKFTGEGFLNQTDWSGGSGQATSTNLTRYFASDGNIETSNPVGDIVLEDVSGEYVSSGIITSSSFDTGSPSNFQKILWNPVDQPVASGEPNVRVQLATSNDGGTWNFAGPDGTSGSYYTVSDQNINSINNGKRFLRYKVFLDSASTTTTPNISDVSFTFSSLCTPPGQVYFNGLPSGAYDLHLSKSGYVSQDIQVNINSGWQMSEVVMLPN
ncbi:MAG TPA: prepilin-type N-terminal cleavage/methylation domain-containing protein [Candidatus Paceibacterota bacterium]